MWLLPVLEVSTLSPTFPSLTFRDPSRTPNPSCTPNPSTPADQKHRVDTVRPIGVRGRGRKDEETFPTTLRCERGHTEPRSVEGRDSESKESTFHLH